MKEPPEGLTAPGGLLCLIDETKPGLCLLWVSGRVARDPEREPLRGSAENSAEILPGSCRDFGGAKLRHDQSGGSFCHAAGISSGCFFLVYVSTFLNILQR